MKKAFILLELMLAVAILSIGLLSLTNIFSISLSAARSSENYFTASLLLEEKIEEIQREVSEGTEEGEFEDYPHFSWQSEVIPYEEIKGLWIIKLTVFWRERGDETEESILKYLYKPEANV